MRSSNNYFDNTSHTVQKKTDKDGINIRYLEYRVEEYNKLKLNINPKDIKIFEKLERNEFYISYVSHPRNISSSGLLAIVYKFKYCKNIIIEAEKITINLDISNYQSFMHLKEQQTSVLRLRIKEINFQEDNLFRLKEMETTETEQCDRAALLIFSFLIYTNLASTLEEIIFLSGFKINLDLLNFLIVKAVKRKINLQFYEYLSQNFPIDQKS